MVDVKDVFQTVVDKKPADFAQGFDALMKDKVAQLVADRKLALATSLFGAPEGLETPEDDDPPQQEKGEVDDGKGTEENPEG